MAIENDEKLNIKKLGERVFLDSGTLTPLLKKLEKKDYVVRTREEKDERNLQISLTEQGKAIKVLLLKFLLKYLMNSTFQNEKHQTLFIICGILF